VKAESLRQTRSSRWVVGGLILVPVVLFVVAGLFGDAGAADHARSHALIGMLAAIVAGTLAIRWPTAGIAASAPAIGFAWFAVAQLLEGVGALGYDTIHDVRGDLAIAHDVGLGASATGLVAIVLGSTVGLAVASRRQQGAARVVGAGIALTLLFGGLFIVKTLIGL
jgi:hypothetical protein